MTDAGWDAMQAAEDAWSRAEAAELAWSRAEARVGDESDAARADAARVVADVAWGVADRAWAAVESVEARAKIRLLAAARRDRGRV